MKTGNRSCGSERLPAMGMRRRPYEGLFVLLGLGLFLIVFLPSLVGTFFQIFGEGFGFGLGCGFVFR